MKVYFPGPSVLCKGARREVRLFVRMSVYVRGYGENALRFESHCGMMANMSCEGEEMCVYLY